MICSICGENKPLKQFGKRSDLPGGYDSRCKVCICEGSKRSLRKRTLQQFANEIKHWPPVKINSEIEWLEAKLAVLRSWIEAA